jgi:hypothetical protein
MVMVRNEAVHPAEANLTCPQIIATLADTVTSRVSTHPEIGIIEFKMSR